MAVAIRRRPNTSGSRSWVRTTRKSISKSNLPRPWESLRRATGGHLGDWASAFEFILHEHPFFGFSKPPRVPSAPFIPPSVSFPSNNSTLLKMISLSSVTFSSFLSICIPTFLALLPPVFYPAFSLFSPSFSLIPPFPPPHCDNESHDDVT